MTARAAIEPLSAIYAFDAVAEGGALAFRPRGGAPVIELDEDALVLPDGGAPARLSRAQETELPREVTLGFTDAGADYRRAAASSRRLVGAASRVVQLDAATVTNDAAASRRADIWLQDVWAGRETAEFALPPSLMRLAPGDVIALTLQGRRRLLEIREIVDTDMRAVKARAIDPEVFDLPLAAPRLQAPVAPPALGPVQAHVLDLPLLDGAEPPVLSHIAMFSDPWPGLMTIWASDDGQSFTRRETTVVPSVIGETLGDLAAGPTSRWDLAGRLRVKLAGGALTSVSDIALLAGANAAAVQHDNGAWEILQFASAELVAEKTYELSRLLRGQAGSEWAMNVTLPAGAPFVLLDAHVVPLARGLDRLGRTMQLRVVAASRDHGDVSALALTATPQPVALQPLSPVHLKAERRAEGILLRWIRRTRLDGDSWDARDVPLFEASEAYEVDILDGETVLRTLNALAPTLLYSNAQETADFGAPQTQLTFRVAQLSATVGRGIAAKATLPVA
jgi:hypothetical protein